MSDQPTRREAMCLAGVVAFGASQIAARSAAADDVNPVTRPAGKLLHIAANTGRAFWGPGDLYTFLATGDDTGGNYFMLDALVAPGGGPPPHRHLREDEAFLLLDGEVSMRVGERTFAVAAGDFVQVPRGTVHAFRNTSPRQARMLVCFSPAGMEGWFIEALDEALDRTADPPPITDAMIARMVAAGPKHGVEWVK